MRKRGFRRPKTCSFEGCDRPRRGERFCPMHYWRHRKGQPMEGPSKRPNICYTHKNKGNPCSVKGCDGPAKVKGLCQTHYWRLQHGKPLDAPLRKRGVVREKTYKVYRMFISGGHEYIGMSGRRYLGGRLWYHWNDPRGRVREAIEKGHKFYDHEIVKEYPFTDEGKELAEEHERKLIGETASRLGDKCLNTVCRNYGVVPPPPEPWTMKKAAFLLVSRLGARETALAAQGVIR